MKLLIINADDLGYDPAVNAGIVRSMREGVVSSATFMVNTPYSVEAATEGRGLALGLHLNFARWKPAWREFPGALLDPGGELIEARANELPAEVAEQETLAQLDRFSELLGSEATHIDVHKHLHLHSPVLDGVLKAAAARVLPVRAINAPMRARVRAAGVLTTDHFIGDAGQQAYWTSDQLAAQLAALPEGTTELMCHPGYAPSHVKSGYSAQREVELATFVDPRARAALADAGVEVGTFASLKRLANG